jgi:hypothetical protein
MQDDAQPNVSDERMETPAESPDDTGLPLDIALSLLKPQELEKLRKYVAAYLAQYGSSEQPPAA